MLSNNSYQSGLATARSRIHDGFSTSLSWLYPSSRPFLHPSCCSVFSHAFSRQSFYTCNSKATLSQQLQLEILRLTKASYSLPPFCGFISYLSLNLNDSTLSFSRTHKTTNEFNWSFHRSQKYINELDTRAERIQAWNSYWV